MGRQKKSVVPLAYERPQLEPGRKVPLLDRNNRPVCDMRVTILLGV